EVEEGIRQAGLDEAQEQVLAPEASPRATANTGQGPEAERRDAELDQEQIRRGESLKGVLRRRGRDAPGHRRKDQRHVRRTENRETGVHRCRRRVWGGRQLSPVRRCTLTDAPESPRIPD